MLHTFPAWSDMNTTSRSISECFQTFLMVGSRVTQTWHKSHRGAPPNRESASLSILLNLNFLTWRTLKFKVLQILLGALSPTQNKPKEPKRSQINPYLDYETGVHILLEDPAYRWFDLAHTDLACFLKSSQIVQSTSNHLKTERCQNAALFNTRLCMHIQKGVSKNDTSFWRRCSFFSGELNSFCLRQRYLVVLSLSIPQAATPLQTVHRAASIWSARTACVKPVSLLSAGGCFLLVFIPCTSPQQCTPAFM